MTAHAKQNGSRGVAESFPGKHAGAVVPPGRRRSKRATAKRDASKPVITALPSATYDLGPVSGLFVPGESVVARARVILHVELAAAASAATQQVQPDAGQLMRLHERLTAIVRASLEFLEKEGGLLRDFRSTGLSEREEELLDAGGLEAAPQGTGAPDAVARTAAEFAELVVESYSVEKVSSVLKVNDSRIRQRLCSEERTLYGFKVGSGWRVPKFQFQRNKLVPGIEAVVASLPHDLDPVSTKRWFTSPSADLELDDGSHVSPLDWLRMGRPPAVVAEIAKDL